ncbi:MAG: MetQ/NlpA family ABC transporter substrate-binding protein [Paraprevotella sp.]|nr:MetQ/NlpA family ABC transporter substrate-binding protein [Paraprevotella sp.]
MKKIFPSFLLFLVLCGCGSSSDSRNDKPKTTEQRDSTALQVALMPTLDCLPFYYADRCGLFQGQGVKVQLQTFNAQMDCDTAFTRRHVDVSYTDLIRAALLQSNCTGLYVIMQIDGYHELITAKSKRIRNTRNLKERMVAIARHSVTDLLLDTVIGQAKLDPSTVYHPQINDIVLRYDMLSNATIDAAFLPEPYATQARLSGNPSIYDSRQQKIRLMAFMASADALKNKKKAEQIRLLIKAYDKAVEQINRKAETDSIRSILLRYPVKPETADTLKLPTYPKARKADPSDVKTALHFLTYRKLISSKYKGDTLVDTQFIQ